MKLISSHSVNRDNSRLSQIQVPPKKIRVMRDKMTFVEERPQSLEDFFDSQPDADVFKLSNVVGAGVTPQMVNPIFVGSNSSEFTQVDNDDTLLSKMEEIENHLNESNSETVVSADTSPTDSTPNT